MLFCQFAERFVRILFSVKRFAYVFLCRRKKFIVYRNIPEILHRIERVCKRRIIRGRISEFIRFQDLHIRGKSSRLCDPLFLYFLDQIVDWTEELELHLILDNHTFAVDSSTATDIDEVLVPVWSQLAEHYRDRSEYLYYEVLNEPHGISDVRWGQIQQEVIDAQQRAIRELSTPIIPILELPQGGSVIVMPLVGSIDTSRARDITRSLLTGIRQHSARVVILDITGVPIVDSGVAAYLNRTIQAARLKGARTIVTGISEAVAETIVDLGIDWSGIETLSDLRTGLRTVLLGRR